MGSVNGHHLQVKKSEIFDYCPANLWDLSGLLIVEESTAFNLSLAVKKLVHLVHILKNKTVDANDRKQLLLASLYFLHYSWTNLTITLNKHGKKTRNLYAYTKHAFTSLIKFEEHYSQIEAIDIIFEFLTVYRLWFAHVFVRDIIFIILTTNMSSNHLFSKIFNKIEVTLSTDVNLSKELLSYIHNLLTNKENNKMIHFEYMTLVVGLQDMFEASMTSVMTNYNMLRKGLNVCLRQICKRLNNDDLLILISKMINSVFVANLTEDDVLEFATVLEYAASLHITKEYVELENQDLFKYTLELMRSQNSFLSLLGCRLLQYLLDRHNNRQKLRSPLVFFEFSELGVNVAKVDEKDINFIEKYRDDIHNSIMSVATMHTSKLANIKQLFACIVLVSLEVPCGLSAAWTAWTAIKLQDLGLKGRELTSTSRYWLHATTLSVMSVVCWVHAAEGLYRPVGLVAERRAQQAPHLSPPLRMAYTHAQYHVTWDKPDLFIDEWELRYGLWNTFNVLNKKKGSAEKKQSIRISHRQKS